MAEDWVKDARSEARAAFDACSEVEVLLGALKEKQSKLAGQMKEAIRTEKQLLTKLREELKKAVQLVKEAIEAEKQVAYTLGVEETQARLTEELIAVCRDYCSISWGKALDAVGVPVGSDLRRPMSIYYDPEIYELPGSDSSHPEPATQVSA